MQTQYKLLYRYMNNTTGTPVTDEAEYNKTEEFYNKDHELNITTEYLSGNVTATNKQGGLTKQGYEFKYTFDDIPVEDYVASLNSEAILEQEKIITENMANDDKSNNLYVYTGTKKYFHKRFVPEQLGYRVRDWTKVPKNQVPSGPDDFSKHFVMLGGSQLGIDKAYLVCKPKFMDSYTNIHSFTISTNDRYGSYYVKNRNFYKKHCVIPNFVDVIDETNWFDWINIYTKEQELKYNEKPPVSKITWNNGQEVTDYRTGEPMLVTGYKAGDYSSWQRFFYIFYSDKEFNANLIIDGSTGGLKDEIEFRTSNNSWPAYKGIPLKTLNANIGNAAIIVSDQEDFKIDYANEIVINKENIVRDIIPAHYEETNKAPYIIKDNYEKIKLSPWMMHSTHNSLESGLTAARKLVAMIGIDNVKLIKYVPFDQFIEIK